MRERRLCTRCKAVETSFCGAACEARWGAQHAAECPLLDPLLGACFHGRLSPAVLLYSD